MIIPYRGTRTSACSSAKRCMSKCSISGFPHTFPINLSARPSFHWPFANAVVVSCLLVSIVINATIDFISGVRIKCRHSVANYIWIRITNCCLRIPIVRVRACYGKFLWICKGVAENNLILDILGRSTPKIDRIQRQMSASIMS